MWSGGREMLSLDATGCEQTMLSLIVKIYLGCQCWWWAKSGSRGRRTAGKATVTRPLLHLGFGPSGPLCCCQFRTLEICH